MWHFFATARFLSFGPTILSGFFSMFRLRFLVFAVVALTLPLKGANAVDQNIILQATVPKYCTIGSSASPTDDHVTVPILSTGNVDTTEIDKSYAVVCNSAATVSLTSLSGAMITTATAVPLFDAFINYRVDTTGFAIVSGTTLHAGANQSLGSVNTPGPANTSLGVKITPQANAHPLAGGDYGDTLTISITPIM
jgi:hypothetical protein